MVFQRESETSLFGFLRGEQECLPGSTGTHALLTRCWTPKENIFFPLLTVATLWSLCVSYLTGSLTASQEGVHPGTGTGRGKFQIKYRYFLQNRSINWKKKKNLRWCSFTSRRRFLAGLTFKTKGGKKNHILFFFFFLSTSFRCFLFIENLNFNMWLQI